MSALPTSHALALAVNGARERMAATYAAARGDSWESSLLGIGGSEDKIASLRYSGFVNRLVDPILEAMFMTEIYAFAGVTTFPQVAFSEGVKYNGLGKPSAACEYLDELWRVPEIATEGAIWGRLYGGCATWIVTDKELELLTEPLEPDEEILALRNIERPFVTPVMDPDTFDAGGHPQYFMITPPQGHIHATVHISRLVMWPGDLTPQRRRIQIGYWDFSVLQRPFDVLKRNGMVSQSAMQLLAEASLGVLSIKDLWSSVTSGQQAALLTRIRLFNQSRAQARAIILDSDRETFDRVNTTFAGVSDLTSDARQEVSAAFRIPITRLMGQAPAGLNATGDADERNFQKDVASYQKHKIEQPVFKLASILLNAGQSPIAPKGLKIGWPDLWAPTAKETSEIYGATATADCALIAAEVITPAQAKSRFKPEGYSQELDVTEYDDSGDPVEEDPNEPDDPADLLGTSEGGNTPDGTAAPVTQLNGAEISTLAELVSDVAAKKLPRDAAAQIIMLGYGVDQTRATAILGSAGDGFETAEPIAPAGPGAPKDKSGAPAPIAKPKPDAPAADDK